MRIEMWCQGVKGDSMVSVLGVRVNCNAIWKTWEYQKRNSFVEKNEFSLGYFEFDALAEPPSGRCSIDSWIYESGAQERPCLEK